MNAEDIDFKSIILKRGNTRFLQKRNWGYEIIIHNDELYCGKVLFIEKNGKSPMFYHVERWKSWYIAKGKILFKSIDVNDGKISETTLCEGDTIEIFVGIPHKFKALEDAQIFEVSTECTDNDIYILNK